MDQIFCDIFFFFWLHHKAYRIWIPQPGINLGPLQWKCRILTIGPSGNPLVRLFLSRTRGSGLKQVTGLPWRYMLSGFSHFWYFATPWTLAHEAALSMGFSRQEYWSGLPFPSPGDLPNPGIESMSPVSPALQADSFNAEPSGKHWISLQTTF